MSFNITVHPSNHQFIAKEGQTILDAALEAGIILPYSCKSGSCGSCKGKVLSGTIEQSPAVSQVVGEEEREQGLTLFCQATATSHLEIESHEIRMASDIQVRKMPVRVVDMEKVADDVMVLKLQMPAAEPFRYYAGQYVEFILKDGRRRSYSMASAPNGNEPVELHIRHMPGGVFTDHVFGAGETQMKVREILRAEGPLGSFFLREDSDKPIVFVVSGTGFAPVKAMMEVIIEKGITRPVTLYWGGRRPKDLYMSELVSQWEAQLPFLTFVPVISDALPEDNWTGRTGFVHKAIIEDFPDLSLHQVYACGAPIMVSSARKEFVANCSLPENEFYADSFTSEADVARLDAAKA